MKSAYNKGVGDTNKVLIAIGGFVILLLFYFQSVRKKVYPTRLRFTDEAKPSADAPVPLNVVFNFNGHSFDAYEALGLPAGSNWDEVQQAYRHNLTNSDPRSKEFYQTAFRALEMSLKRAK